MNDALYHFVAIEHLRPGMYIVLPGNWLDHPFLRNRFRIRSEAELQRIRGLGLKSIQVDLSKSRLPVDFKSGPEQTATSEEYDGCANTTEGPAQAIEIPERWDPARLIPAPLLEAIADKSMQPEQRSRAIYHHSRQMMERLFERPEVGNIKTSKKVIGDISECILADDQTATNMLRITAHDFYTCTHSVNVGVTALLLAKELFRNSDAHDLRELGAGFFLHDLGKVKVNPEVINKPGRLSEAEMQHMRIHPYQGHKLLDLAGEMSDECRCILMQHHERADGSGYPQRLRGDEIHTYARICCIADVFDALTAERSYKKALSTFEALKLMKGQMSGHFDSVMFSTFVRMYSRT